MPNDGRGRDSDVPGETDLDLVAAVRGNASDAASLIGHLYRAEIDRTTAWRSRLDQTTNWAVVVVAAILTWAFSSRDNPHYVLLIGMLAVAGFLLIEAHRFQEYDVWRTRVRTLQKHFFAAVLDSPSADDEGWQAGLGDSLDEPSFTMPLRSAVRHRLRRTYLSLLLVLLVAWVARITAFQPGEGWRRTAAIPGLDGMLVVLTVAGGYALVVLVAVWPTQRGEMREFRK